MAYIRTKDGQTGEIPDDEAVLNWISEDGYRITVAVGSFELILRRAEDSVHPGHLPVHVNVNDVDVTVRRRR